MDLTQYGQHVYSEKIQENIWVVKNELYREKFIKEGAIAPIFTWAEVEKLKGVGITPAQMKKVWLMRKYFPESNIESVIVQPTGE